MFFFIPVTPKQPAIMEKANIKLLTKEGTEKSRSLKTQILVTTAQSEIFTKPIWQKNFIRKQLIATRNGPEKIDSYEYKRMK